MLPKKKRNRQRPLYPHNKKWSATRKKFRFSKAKKRRKMAKDSKRRNR